MRCTLKNYIFLLALSVLLNIPPLLGMGDEVGSKAAKAVADKLPEVGSKIGFETVELIGHGITKAIPYGIVLYIAHRWYKNRFPTPQEQSQRAMSDLAKVKAEQEIMRIHAEAAFNKQLAKDYKEKRDAAGLPGTPECRDLALLVGGIAGFGRVQELLKNFNEVSPVLISKL